VGFFKLPKVSLFSSAEAQDEGGIGLTSFSRLVSSESLPGGKRKVGGKRRRRRRRRQRRIRRITTGTTSTTTRRWRSSSRPLRSPGRNSGWWRTRGGGKADDDERSGGVGWSGRLGLPASQLCQECAIRLSLRSPFSLPPRLLRRDLLLLRRPSLWNCVFIAELKRWRREAAEGKVDEEDAQTTTTTRLTNGRSRKTLRLQLRVLQLRLEAFGAAFPACS
jgi:hypothetical protein